MKRLYFFTIAAFLSSPAFAQQGADIERVCMPIMLKAAVASVEEKTKSQLFRHYVTLIYNRRDESLEKLEKEGFELGFAIEEVPLKALWSKDENERKRAESVYSKYVDNKLLQENVREYKEVKDNSFATADYVRCVIAMRDHPSPLGCFYGAATERDRVTFNVVFRPSFVISNKRISKADIVNGFMVPTEQEAKRLTRKQKTALDEAIDAVGRGEKLRAVPAGASSKLKISNRELDTGVHSFDIIRLDPDRQTSVNLEWENGLNCHLPIDPVARSNVSAAIWPDGRDWVANSDVFVYDLTSGCGPGQPTPQEFCTSSDARIVSIAPANPVSVNCRSSFQGAVMKPNSDKCIIATGIAGGCGFTKPWKTCKGRGWVKATIPVTKDVAGKSYSPQRFVESYSSVDPSWTKLFEYSGELPQNFEADAWKFNIQIKRQLPSGVDTYVLTDSDPEQGDCIAKIAGDKRSGRVVVSCGPQRALPASLPLLLAQ